MAKFQNWHKHKAFRLSVSYRLTEIGPIWEEVGDSFFLPSGGSLTAMEVGDRQRWITPKDLSAVGFDLNEHGISNAYIREIITRMEQSLHIKENVMLYFSI